jgi:UDP-GlcNAc:undecaprenyl-phosphate GlcNAc-1-phosphate transferase
MDAPTPYLYILTFVLSSLMSLILVPYLRQIANRYAILDLPNQAHKTHHESIPYLGGLAIIIPILTMGLLGFVLFSPNTTYTLELGYVVGAALVLAMVGLYDDIKNTSARLRLLIQSILAVAVTVFLIKKGFSIIALNHDYLDFLFSVFWIVGITNSVNLFDNLDGAVAGVTMVVTAGLFVLTIMHEQFIISLFSSALFGASLGFLFWNRNPARIYLGDSGALFIGFLLAVVLIQYEPRVESRFVGFMIPVFLVAPLIMDTTVAVLGRLWLGISIFQGGRDHLSHRLVVKGASRSGSAIQLWILAALFSTVSIFLVLIPNAMAIVLSLATLALMAALVVWFLTVKVSE